jgi:hypothetical protein
MLAIFKSMHFYRNMTKSKSIPVPIIRSAHLTFSIIALTMGVGVLVQRTDAIQKNILLMVLKSEGDKIKHVTSPSRDRKYTIIAYSQLLLESSSSFESETLSIVINSLIELCSSSPSLAGMF